MSLTVAAQFSAQSSSKPLAIEDVQYVQTSVLNNAGGVEEWESKQVSLLQPLQVSNVSGSPRLLVVLLLFYREEKVLSDDICGERDDRNAKAGKHLAQHGPPFEHWVFPPRIPFCPRIAVNRWRGGVCHLHRYREAWEADYLWN